MLEVFRTHNLDEAMSAVGRVYCPHTVVPKGTVRNVDAALVVARVCEQPVVNLRYSAAVEVNAGRFPDLLLIMSASSGAASAKQGSYVSQWRHGQTMPLSPGLDTVLQFDRDFVQSSLRVEVERVESMCARWLGRPLDEPIRFILKPFGSNFEAIWQDAMRMTAALGTLEVHAPRPAYDSLDEFLLSLILHGHSHNYSDALVQPVKAALPRIVYAAVDLFHEYAASGTTVSAVARELGVSLRSLQLGFRASGRGSPSEVLRRIRLEAVREALMASTARTSVTDAALAAGFIHMGRFSSAYKAAFGEVPSVTLKRSRKHH